MGAKSKSTNVPIEDLIVKSRDLNRRKRENRRARAVALKLQEALDDEAMANSLGLDSGCSVGRVGNGNFDVKSKPSSVVRVRGDDSRGGVYRIRATKAPHFVTIFLPTSELKSKPPLAH